MADVFILGASEYRERKHVARPDQGIAYCRTPVAAGWDTFVVPAIDALRSKPSDLMPGHNGVFARRFPIAFTCLCTRPFTGLTDAGSTCSPSLSLLSNRT